MLNIQRETAANTLAQKITRAPVRKDGPLTIHNTSGTALQCLQLAYSGTESVSFEGDGLEACTVIPMGSSIFAMLKFSEIKPSYTVHAYKRAPEKKELCKTLESAGAKLVFGDGNRIEKLLYGSKIIGGSDLLSSYITYGKKRYDFSYDELAPGEITGGECTEIKGSINLPGAVRQGSFSFRFFTSDAAPGLFCTKTRY